jgi:hypothetical protein
VIYPASAPKSEPNPTPETPKSVTPTDNGDNNGNNNGTPSDNGTPTNNGEQTPIRELSNTGIGNEFAIFGAAASAILAGLGIAAPGKKKEEQDEA